MKGAFFTKKTSSSNGFTLVEVLIVMIVIATLIAITWSGFFGLRTAMALHQTGESFRSDVVNAQRSAMLLKRGEQINWVRGVIIDLRELVSPPTGETAQYSIRTWCSNGSSYVDFAPVNIPAGVSTTECNEQFLAPMGYEQKKLAGGDLDVCITHKNQGATPPDIKAVLFESVNGRPHFYRYVSADNQFKNVDSLYEGTSNSNVRIAFYRGDRWDAVIIHLDGKIEFETWDSTDHTPCGV